MEGSAAGTADARGRGANILALESLDGADTPAGSDARRLGVALFGRELVVDE
jgi:hypothetical protein